MSLGKSEICVFTRANKAEKERDIRQLAACSTSKQRSKTHN